MPQHVGENLKILVGKFHPLTALKISHICVQTVALLAGVNHT